MSKTEELSGYGQEEISLRRKEDYKTPVVHKELTCIRHGRRIYDKIELLCYMLTLTYFVEVARHKIYELEMACVMLLIRRCNGAYKITIAILPLPKRQICIDCPPNKPLLPVSSLENTFQLWE